MRRRPRAPFYRITFHVSPARPGLARLVRPPVDGSSAFAGNAGERELHRLDDAARAAFAAVTRDIDPYPAPVVVAALVDGRPVDRPGVVPVAPWAPGASSRRP